MSEAEKAQVEEQETATEESETEESKEPELSADDIKAIIEERDRLKAKHQEAEKHRKEAERKAKEVERERQEAERKKAEEEGNHQKLWETEKERADRLEAELQERMKEIEERDERAREMTRDTETVNLVSELTSDAKRQKALKKLVRDHVQVSDDGTQYQVDGVTIDKSRFVKYIREEYPSLVDGSGMTGGGATGANGSGAANTTKGQDAKAKGDLTGFLQAQFNT